MSAAANADVIAPGDRSDVALGDMRTRVICNHNCQKKPRALQQVVRQREPTKHPSLEPSIVYKIDWAQREF